MQKSRLSGFIGLEISGIDIRDLLASERGQAHFRELLSEHLVLSIDDQSLSPEELSEVSAVFGEPSIPPHRPFMESIPHLFELTSNPDSAQNFGSYWHQDLTYLKEPVSTIIVYGRDVPEAGGDTLFSNQIKAYDELNENIKEYIRGMKGFHSNLSQLTNSGHVNFDPNKEEYRVRAYSHPLVIRHGPSGKPALFVNDYYMKQIESDITIAEQNLIRDYLCNWAIQDRFTCRVKHRKGRLIIWDNTATLHNAIDDYRPQKRSLLRIACDPRPIERFD